MVLESTDVGPLVGDSSHMKTTMKAYRGAGLNKMSVKQKLWLLAKAAAT